MTESEWEVLDLGGDDETRQSATGLISFGSLYEVVKLAYLKPSAIKEQDVPRAVCSAAHGMVCVTLDCALLLFAESCSTLVLQLRLPHPVETVLWLGSPNFLIATDRSGQLHFIHVPSRRLLITRQLTPEGDTGNCAGTLLSAHCQLLTEGCCSLLFLAASGLLIRVNNVPLERIEDGLSRGCVAELVEAERQLSFDYTPLTGRPLVCAGGVVGACEAQVLLWGATRDGDVLQLVQVKEEEGCPAEGGAAEEVLVKLPFVCSKLLPVASGRYLLALSEAGAMAVVCTGTGVIRLCGPPGTPQAAAASPPGRVLDAVLLPWTESSAQPQLLALVEPGPPGPACLLRVLALPGLECEYELSVLRGSSLVPLAEGVEAMIFLEPELSTHALKIKTIVDGVPETRLRKLISKQKFEEALQFAALFSLDVSLVAKGRARLLLQQLNPYRPAPAPASFLDCGSLLEQVLSVLDTIDDCAFVGSVCVEAVLPDVRSTETLLSYAAKRLADPKSEKYEGTSALRDQVGRLQHRLGTFLRLQPADTDPALWAAFVAADPLDLCIQHLTTGALSMSSCIWQRHQHEFSSRVDEEFVERVLQSVPASLPSHALVSWLPHSVADLLALCPRALPLLVDWVLVRVRRLECREKQLWPDNGLRVGNTVMAAIERGMGSVACGSAVCPDAAVKQLRHMLQALQQLQTLLRDYRLRVPLQQYMQREVAQVCSSVLQWLVCGEEVAQLVQRFLVPVLCGGDRAAADAVLQQYVQHELDQVQQQQWLLGEQHEAHWEDKLHAVTRSISSQQVRVRCMVLCVERASVPWSGGTEALCDEALQAVTAAGHRGSRQLLELRSLARLKVTLGRHDLRIGELGDFRTAQVVLRKLARSKQEGVLEAMLQVVATFHHLQPSQAYQHRIYHLLQQGDYAMARSTLQGVPQQHVQDTCCRLLHDILQTLHHAPICKQMREVRERVAEGAVSLQQLLLQHAPSRDRSQWRTDLNAVAALSRLQLQYGEHPSWRRLHDPLHCRHLLQQHVARWFESRKSSDPETADPSCPTRAPALRDITALATNTSDAGERQLGERNTSGPKRKLNTLAEQENVGPGAVVEVPATARGEEKTSTIADPHGEERWGEVARLLELGSLLGQSRVAVLQLVAAVALQQEDVGPALWAIGLLAEDPLTTTASDCRGDSSSDLTALVHKLQRLLLLQLETLCRPKTDTEEGDCFSIVSDAPAAVEGRHAATARLLHHTLRIVSAALLQASPEWLRWLCGVAVWGSAGSMLYERCHKTEAYGTDSAAQSDATSSFTPLYWDKGMPLVARQVSGALLEAVRWCLATYDSTLAAMSSSSSYDQPPNGALGSLVESVSSLTSHALQRNSDLTALLMHTKVASLVKIDANNSLGNDATDSCKPPPQLSQLLNSQLVFSLLLKLIQPSRTDGRLAVSILSLLPLREALSILNELIKRFGFDYSRLEAVSELGVSLCGMHKQVDIRVKFEDLGKNARWGKRFAEMNISFKDYFGKAVAILQKLFDVIVQHPNCTCSLLKDFCVDFNLSFTDAMLCYLCHLVRKGMPEVQEDGSIRSTDAFSIEQLAQVSARVDDRVLLRKTLLFELQQAHSYHYDAVYFLLRELCAMDEPEGTNQVWQRGLDILHFLRGYKRKAKPHNVELDEWLQKNPSLNSLPSVATQRLPFSELFQGTAKLIMKIIDGELDVLTIDSWLRCSDSLKLNQDEMCFVAVQNTVSRSLDRRVRQDATKVWELTACHSDLLKDVSSVILKIKHDKLAMACGKSVVQLLPPGADRVQCTKSCLLMAQRWYSHCESEESREAVAKFASEYERLLVEQALHHHALALPKYLKLVGDPVALVKTLYHHPSLATFSGSNSDSMPRVNECVTEICQAVKCNQSLVQKELLDQWLPPPDAGLGSGGDDVTISNFTISLLSTAGSAASAADSEQDTLARAMYLVRGCCADTIIPYLLERVESSSSVVSAAHRLRALHCLTALADSHLMDTYVAPHTLQTYLEQLTLAVRLESLGIVCEPEQLDDMDKSALTEQLWRDHRHSPTALLLIADICLRYKVLKAPLWNAVLQQLAVCEEGDAVQESALRSLLLRLRLHPQLWLLQGFVASWTALVSQPFKNVSPPLSPAAVVRCTSAASLLSQCPVALPAVHQLVPAAVQLRLFAVAICVAAALPETRHLMQEVWDATPAAELQEQFTCLRSEMALPRLVEALLETNGMSLQ